MRLFAVKLILSNQQKYESRSNISIFDIFFLNDHASYQIKQNVNKHLFEYMKEKVLWNICFLIDSQVCTEIAIFFLKAQIGVKLF